MLIKTHSFELAINTEGDPDADKLAICIPGRLDTKDYANFVSHLEFLADQGFYAVSFDPPGTWDSPGPIDLYTTTNYIKAVNELIEHFGKKEVLLLGHSRGGAISVLVGCSNPLVKAMVLVMAALGDPTPPDSKDIKQGFKLSLRDLPPGDKKTSDKKKFELPINYWTDGEKYDVLGVLRKCTKPKLIFAGSYDEFFTLEEMQEIIDSIPDQKIYHVLKTEHDYRLNPKIIKEVNQVVGKFVEKYHS